MYCGTLVVAVTPHLPITTNPIVFYSLLFCRLWALFPLLDGAVARAGGCAAELLVMEAPRSVVVPSPTAAVMTPGSVTLPPLLVSVALSHALRIDCLCLFVVSSFVVLVADLCHPC